ncbi:MAG: hypothetical protein ACPL1D_02885 [Microgenomates group bacterium]
MNSFKLGKDALIFSVITLITVLTWIGFEIYFVATKTTIPKVTQEQMAPLNPKIKKETIEQLKANLWFSEEELNTFNFPVSTQSAQKE